MMVLKSPWARPIIATIVVVVVLIGQAVGTGIYGHLRVPSQVRHQLEHGGTAEATVVLGFTPEQFNLDYLQALGNVVNTHGDTLNMSGLTSSAVTAIAGQYWVADVRPWDGR